MLRLRDSCSVRGATSPTCSRKVSSILLATKANLSSCVMWHSVGPSTCTDQSMLRSLKVAITVSKDADAWVLTSTNERLWVHKATVCPWDLLSIILNPQRRFKKKSMVVLEVKTTISILVEDSVVLVIALVSHNLSTHWTTMSTSSTPRSRLDSVTSSKSRLNELQL